jgi:hypothetical protein
MPRFAAEQRGLLRIQREAAFHLLGFGGVALVAGSTSTGRMFFSKKFNWSGGDARMRGLAKAAAGRSRRVTRAFMVIRF